MWRRPVGSGEPVRRVELSRPDALTVGVKLASGSRSDLHPCASGVRPNACGPRQSRNVDLPSAESAPHEQARESDLYQSRGRRHRCEPGRMTTARVAFMQGRLCFLLIARSASGHAPGTRRVTRISPAAGWSARTRSARLPRRYRRSCRRRPCASSPRRSSRLRRIPRVGCGFAAAAGRRGATPGR